MTNLQVYAASGQQTGSPDEQPESRVPPVEAALSLTDQLEILPGRGIQGGGWQVLKHVVRERDQTIAMLTLRAEGLDKELKDETKRHNSELKAMADSFAGERRVLDKSISELEKKLSVAEERVAFVRSSAIWKTFFTLIGTAVAGMGLDIYKSGLGSAGIILMALGIMTMVISEVSAILRGFRK